MRYIFDYDWCVLSRCAYEDATYASGKSILEVASEPENKVRKPFQIDHR